MIQNSLLYDKISVARQRLLEVWSRFGARALVGWTGGKDSTVVLHLWRDILRSRAPEGTVRALSSDTGCKFAEVLAFRDSLAREWGVQVHVARPDVSPGYPVAVDPVTCCRDLKIEPLRVALVALQCPALLTGVRADEHPQRTLGAWWEEHAEPTHVRVAPLLEWTELDVWTYLVRSGVPWCSLYDLGYRSLGCVPCTTCSGEGERSGRDARKEARMEQLRSLGYF